MEQIEDLTISSEKDREAYDARADENFMGGGGITSSSDSLSIYSNDAAPPPPYSEEELLNAEELQSPPPTFTTAPPRLPCPVVIPQRRPGSKTRGFMRAYAPVLADYDISEAAFLNFLKSFHKASLVILTLRSLSTTPYPLSLVSSSGND